MMINRREMAFLVLGGAFIIAIMFYLIILSPAISKQRSLTGHIERKEKDLAGMTKLKDRWDRFKANKARVEKKLALRGKKFALLSFLEGISREVGINDKIQYMKPVTFHDSDGPLKPVGIEITLNDINIKQLTNLLYKIEVSDKLLNIKRIKIQRVSRGKQNLLKVTLQVDTYTYT